MKCEICKKTVQVNYGNANHIFCKECSDNNTAQQIIEKNLAEMEITTKDSIDIPLRTAFTSILIITAFFGLLILLFYQLYRYNEQLALPIIAGFILIFLIINITKNVYYRKLISNKIIARSVKNKLNHDVIFGIIILAMSIAGFILEVNRATGSYAYLLQEKYIPNVFQMFNLELLKNLESYAYENNHIMLYNTILTIQDRLIRLLNMCAFLVIGVANLHNGLHSDAISQIGILTKGNVLKWREFTAYNWSKFYEDQTIKNSNGYYDLELVSENGKLLTYILGEKESRKSLKIRAQDKVKVDKLLRNVITNCS